MININNIISSMNFDLFGIGYKLDNLKTSIDEIAQLCAQISWVFQHPYEAFRFSMMGIANFSEYVALFVCGVAIIMAIFGNKDWLKYVPKSIILYTMLKIFVVLL